MATRTPGVPGNGVLRPPRHEPDRHERRPLAALGHPLTLGAVALLLLNDHVLKQAFPSILTGKLTDFAMLFFFPFVLAAVVGLIGRRAGRPRRTEAALALVPRHSVLLRPDQS